MDRGKSIRSKTTKGAKERDENMVDWSKLPVDILRLIFLRLFSLVELVRFRSICSSWRSSVSNVNNPFRSHHLINVKPLIVFLYRNIHGHERIRGLHHNCFLSRAAFFRVSLSSSPNQGWLIKSDLDINIKKLHLLNCLSRLALKHIGKSLDLLEFTVSEIREVYEVQEFCKKTTLDFKRVVIVKDAGGDHHQILVIGCDGKIRKWNLSGRKWSRVPDQIAHFTDIIVHKGFTYALDSKGIIWWISSSCNIYRYGPSLDENIAGSCGRDMSFVECCGELYIVERLFETKSRKRKAGSSIDTNAYDAPWFPLVVHDDVGNVPYSLESESLKTVGFKVYKMDEELMKWMEVNSLGEYAFVMATDGSFSVLAREFYGCLQNSVYFIHNNEDRQIKVFKLDDGNITTMSESEKSCFQMFVPSFL